MRTSTDTGSRVTDSQLLRLGGEWARDRLLASAEISTSSVGYLKPWLNVHAEFYKPELGNTVQEIDNGVPIAFDLTGGN